MHRLGRMEGYLSTLNKMINRSEAGQEATACLLGKAPQVKATQSPAANTSLRPAEVVSVAGEKHKDNGAHEVTGKIDQ